MIYGQRKVTNLDKSTPSLHEFDPTIIGYQKQVIDDIYYHFDYSQGCHEVLLSGSVGCLKEDALVETIDGLIPISSIKPQDYVLSYHHQKNRFVFQSCSGAFPKGKDYLYRVIHEHGEFVASANHLCATCHGNYLPVASFSSGSSLRGLLSNHHQKHHVAYQRSLLSDVLRYWNIISSLIYHCVEHIRQHDQQLLFELNTFLDIFPLQADAQEYDQFSYKNTLLHEDDLKGLELEHGRIVESNGHASMLNLICLLENKILGVEVQDACAKSYEHNLSDILQSPLFHLHDVHPKVLLSFVYRICIPFLKSLYKFKDTTSTNSAILSIEKQSKKEWYWDMQVPNTNNYFANGALHHNSAKSILMAHIAVRHCIENVGARVLLGRKALPDLKDTIYLKILEHMEGTLGEGKDFEAVTNIGKIRFRNGSEIISRSWSDKKYKKLRSLELSMAIIEELTENNEEDKQAYDEIKMRVGRLPHLDAGPLVICATNPDSPAHWAYKYFIASDVRTRHVYYSVTTDNPFLPSQYIEQLKRDMDPKQALRMIEGKWIHIEEESVYHCYDKEKNFVPFDYSIDLKHQINISFDFNIGEGKPLSCVLFQFINDIMHIFDEVVVEGMRTNDVMDELDSRGLLNYKVPEYIINGDATGKHKDTRSIHSDYDIIKKFLSNYRNKDGNNIKFEIRTPKSNPPIRKRHNLVNSYCENTLGERRLYVYKNAKTADEGLRLTALKKGGQYIEDDSKPYQHITTAIGYGLHSEVLRRRQSEQTTRML